MTNNQIEVKAADIDLKGHFSNLAQLQQQNEHFILDFFLVAPPAGQLVSRVVVTPGHMKALSNAINDQLKIYEENFGKVQAAAPQKNKIGFAG